MNQSTLSIKVKDKKGKPKKEFIQPFRSYLYNTLATLYWVMCEQHSGYYPLTGEIDQTTYYGGGFSFSDVKLATGIEAGTAKLPFEELMTGTHTVYAPYNNLVQWLTFNNSVEDQAHAGYDVYASDNVTFTTDKHGNSNNAAWFSDCHIHLTDNSEEEWNRYSDLLDNDFTMFFLFNPMDVEVERIGGPDDPEVEDNGEEQVFGPYFNSYGNIGIRVMFVVDELGNRTMKLIGGFETTDMVVETSTLFPAGTWYNIVIEYDASAKLATIRKDGLGCSYTTAQAGEGAKSEITYSSGDYWTMGKAWEDVFSEEMWELHGLMDNFGIIKNGSLTSSQQSFLSTYNSVLQTARLVFAPHMFDNNFENEISNGTGVGELYYYPLRTTLRDINTTVPYNYEENFNDVVGGEVEEAMVMEMNVVNWSSDSGTIYVNEVGIFNNIGDYNAYRRLFIKDILDEEVVLEYGDTMQLSYTFFTLGTLYKKLTKNFLRAFGNMINYNLGWTYLDTQGEEITPDTYVGSSGYDGGDGYSRILTVVNNSGRDYGIVVGNGYEYALVDGVSKKININRISESKLTYGTTSVEFLHGHSSIVHDPPTGLMLSDFSITREFTNLTNRPIRIENYALVARGKYKYTEGQRPFMILDGKFKNAFYIPPRGTIYLKIKIFASCENFEI